VRRTLCAGPHRQGCGFRSQFAKHCAIHEAPTRQELLECGGSATAFPKPAPPPNDQREPPIKISGPPPTRLWPSSRGAQRRRISLRCGPRPGASPQAPSLAQTSTVTFPQHPFWHPQQFPLPRVLLPYRCSNLVSWALSVKPIPLEVIDPHENSVPNCLGGCGSGFPIPAGLPEYPRAGSSSCVHPRSRRLARRPGPSAASPRRHSDSRRRASGHRRNQPRHR
jgi:hypothetical protein